MKRVIVAIVLLVLVAGGSVLSLYNERKNTDYLIELTDQIEEAFSAEDMERAQALTDRFAEEFPERTKFFPFFMRHSDVTKIEENVIMLPILLQAGDMEHFPAELVRCRNQLDKLSELEVPLWENIL